MQIFKPKRLRQKLKTGFIILKQGEFTKTNLKRIYFWKRNNFWRTQNKHSRIENLRKKNVSHHKYTITIQFRTSSLRNTILQLGQILKKPILFFRRKSILEMSSLIFAETVIEFIICKKEIITPEEVILIKNSKEKFNFCYLEMNSVKIPKLTQ